MAEGRCGHKARELSSAGTLFSLLILKGTSVTQSEVLLLK